jgi:hypothetical protein
VITETYDFFCRQTIEPHARHQVREPAEWA